MNESCPEQARLKSLLIRLKAQLAELEDAYALTLDPYKRAELKATIEDIRQKIDLYEKEFGDVSGRRERAGTKPSIQPGKLRGIEVTVEELAPEVRKGFDESEKQFEKAGYLPTRKFRIDVTVFLDLLNSSLKARLPHEKGRTLEEAASYLFASCGHLFDVLYSRKLTPTHEIDKVVFTIPGSFFREWGDFLIVECKNRKSKASTRDIDTLIASIRGTKSRAGVLFSMAGVTRIAMRNIRENYLRYDLIIIVIDKKDLQEIAKGANFIKLLWDKYKALRFG